MAYYKKILLLGLFGIPTGIRTDESVSSSVYHQIVPLLTKKIDVVHATAAQQNLLTGAAAFLEHGTNHSSVNPDIIQAIASVDFFTDILPHYLQTNTVSGTIQAALLVAQMTDDFATLQHRQAIIQYFNQHPEMLQRLTTAFAQAKSGEEALLNSFSFNQQTITLTNGMKSSVKEKLYFSDSYNYLNNKYILDTLKRVKTSDLVMIPNIVLAMIQVKLQTGISFNSMLKVCTPENLKAFGKRFSEFVKQDPKAAIFLGSAIGSLFVLNYMFVKPDVKQDFNLIYAQQQELIEIAKLIGQMKQVNHSIAHDAILQEKFAQEQTKLNELFNAASTTTSQNLKYVISELQSSSFEGDPTYYFSLQGKILATHYYLQACKAELISYLEAFGKIDAYVSVANLYQTFKNHPRVTFCFPEFIASSTPVLDITDYWHPLIDTNVVVTNSLHMGNNGAKNLIITGPNAGGKTTSLMSLMINIIFAQSFGIAPSAKFVFTPFAKIHSYLDITTNLQAGLSLFAAEVDRAKKLKTSILSCTGNQKTFTIIDEIFSGTAAQVAADVGCKFATQLGDISRSMAIITTHIKELTQVGQEAGTFTNYKVSDATIMPDGKVVYPFTLVPGISNQNIAQHMLEQQDII